MYLKKFLICFFILICSNIVFADETIKAENNAYRHNNKGLIFLEEHYYYGAIKEFQIAIDLNPKSQAAATYYTNLGKTYEKIGHADLAKDCYEKALSLNVLCFDYYLQLAKVYQKLGMADSKLEEYKLKNTPLSNVMIGLLYIQKGQTSTGITILDEFCNNEEKLLLSKGVRNYLNEITKEST